MAQVRTLVNVTSRKVVENSLSWSVKGNNSWPEISFKICNFGCKFDVRFFLLLLFCFRCSTCSDVWQVVISHCVFSLHFGCRSGLCVLSGTFCVRSYIVYSYTRCKNMRRKSQALTGTLIQSWRGLVLLCKSNLRKTSRINKVSRNATQIILN